MLRMYWLKETSPLDYQRFVEASGGGQGELTI
jgi:hypothetical protein